MANDNQSTPQAFFDDLNSRYHFILDAAANGENHKCPRWYGPGGEAEDALAVEWPTDGWIWCNPPYSRGMQWKFLNKAEECSRRGGMVMMLLPADTSTKLFHHCYDFYRITFIKGRLKFNGVKSPAKFGSMLVEITEIKKKGLGFLLALFSFR